jgi:integrase
MARAKMPAWQLFQYAPTKDESGRWTARGRYNDDAGVRHDIKRSGRTKGAADLALRRAVEEAQKRAEQRRKEAEAAKAEASVVTLEELSERWLAVRKPSPVKIDQTTQTGASPTSGLRMQTWTSGRPSDIVKFLFATGLRIGEALAVRWDDIRFDGDRILITVSGTLIEKDGLFYRQDYPKTDSQRILQLTQDWIQDMIRQRHMNRRVTRTNAVFATRNGTFVRPSNLRADLRKAKKAAGTSEKISPHRS